MNLYLFVICVAVCSAHANNNSSNVTVSDEELKEFTDSVHYIVAYYGGGMLFAWNLTSSCNVITQIMTLNMITDGFHLLRSLNIVFTNGTAITVFDITADHIVGKILIDHMRSRVVLCDKNSTKWWNAYTGYQPIQDIINNGCWQEDDISISDVLILSRILCYLKSNLISD